MAGRAEAESIGRVWGDGAGARPIEARGEAIAASDDEGLVLRAKVHPAAFAPLYARYVGPVYGYCFGRLGTRELAEDATSQVFTKALAALPRYRAKSFRAWLFTIAHHTITDVYRRRPTAALDEAAGIADHARSPEDEAILADGERNVRRLLTYLTPDQRAVVELRLAGLGGAEIAAVLGRRQGAIRSAEFRAYARLRELLGSEGERA